jgi:hypothetical protein
VKTGFDKKVLVRVARTKKGAKKISPAVAHQGSDTGSEKGFSLFAGVGGLGQKKSLLCNTTQHANRIHRRLFATEPRGAMVADPRLRAAATTSK